MTTRQTMIRDVTCFVFLALALSLGGNAAYAEFMLVEDFEGLDLGSIDGQNGWYASGTSSNVVTLSGQGDNQVLELVVSSGVLRKGLTIPEDETRMLFLRFRFDGQHNYSLGMSHLATPTEYDDFGPELRRVTAQNRLEIHNGLYYELLAEVAPLTWYNLWALVDNASGTTQVWLHARDGEAAEAGDQLAAGEKTVFNFRSFGGGDLINFYLKSADGGSGRDPLWLDDIHMEALDGPVNLSNPVPEPTTPSLLGDANRDGIVDMVDYAVWFNNYGSTGVAWEQADFDANEIVDMVDYAIWFDNYGSTSGSTVPEPATLALLAVGWLGLRRRGSRKPMGPDR